MEDRSPHPSESSRRSVIKRAAAASALVPFGLAASGATAGQRRSRRVLVFAGDYVPGGTFRVVGRLDPGITLSLLRGPGGDGVPNPDEYQGYVVDYRSRSVPAYAFLFVRDDGGFAIQRGRRYRFAREASPFVGSLNLLETRIRPADGRGDEGTDTPAGTATGTGTATTEPGTATTGTGTATTESGTPSTETGTGTAATGTPSTETGTGTDTPEF